jgi:hypothetical protein
MTVNEVVDINLLGDVAHQNEKRQTDLPELADQRTFMPLRFRHLFD